MGLKSLMAQWSAMVPINVAMENGGPGLKMYFLLKIGIFHCYVSLLEGTCQVLG